MTPALAPDLAAIAARAEEVGIRRVHALAWRDLDDPAAGGSEVHASEVLARWAAAGIDVTLHAAAVPGAPARARRHGIEVRRRGGPVTAWLAGPAGVALAVDRATDAVLEVWHGLSFLAPLWTRVPTVGIFHHVHSRQFHQVLPRGVAHAAEIAERYVYPRVYRARPLVTLSASVRAEMVRELGWDPAHLHVVEPGVADRFAPGGQRSPAPLVVSVGRLMPQKRFDDAIDALVLARRTCPDLEAVIVGDGPERPRLEAKVADAGATPWLRLAGRIEDAALVDLYRRAWVLLSASRHEGWGMTVTEAAACATPSVATDISGHRDAVVDGTTGILASDVAGLAAGVIRLVTEPDLRDRMGAAAVVHAAGHRWDAAARRIFDVLASEAVRLRRTT